LTSPMFLLLMFMCGQALSNAETYLYGTKSFNMNFQVFEFMTNGVNP